jgi:NAD(P)-dependent dehydrogenase (short-subunit alcohol dehydrogenase family)
MSDLAGKHGLIVGVANKRSISWAIAQAAAAAGARLALTYPSERLEENVRELAATLDNPLVLPCDVGDDQQIATLGATLDREFGGLDFLVHGAAFAPADVWPLAILAPACLFLLWHGRPPREAAMRGFLFTAGTFAAGTYWLYHSIHLIGQAPIWLALFLMFGMVSVMGAYSAAAGYAVTRWGPSRGLVRWLALLPASWVLVECS